MPSDPGPLLIEQRIEQGEDLFVRRITTTGEVWTRSRLMRRDEEGWLEDTGTPEWELEIRLAPGALERLRTTLTGSGFFELPAELRPDGAVIGAGDEIWTAVLDDRTQTVHLHAAGVTDAPVLAGLAAAVVEAMAESDV